MTTPARIRAVFQGGVFRPLDAVNLPDNAEVDLTVLDRTVQALPEQAESRRVAREDRLRSLGSEDPSEEQRREQLGRNVALREWPKS